MQQKSVGRTPWNYTVGSFDYVPNLACYTNNENNKFPDSVLGEMIQMKVLLRILFVYTSLRRRQ